MKEVEEFAHNQLQKYNLQSWKFVWDTRACRRYGQCRYDKQEIGVSKKMAIINTLEENKNVILHEIAHALTGPGHGHDRLWKQKCLLVGARPERCYNSKNNGGTVNTVNGKYKVIHKMTGTVYKIYHRKPTIEKWETRFFRGKKKETLGNLQLVPF